HSPSAEELAAYRYGSTRINILSENVERYKMVFRLQGHVFGEKLSIPTVFLINSPDAGVAVEGI
ncbi:MAG: hypothetical protein OSJ69_20415, partial [Acetatifactor sp.]|nr:hypothetical protein [Acetatifactor sp.]